MLNKLEEEQINPTGLMELFENQSSDFLFGRNDYIEILWGDDTSFLFDVPLLLGDQALVFLL